MNITVETILDAIEKINERKRDNLIIKPNRSIMPNTIIGIDSLALILNVKVDDIEPIIDEMISYNILEQLPHTLQSNGGRKGWKKVRLKE